MSLSKYFFESDDSDEKEEEAVMYWIKTGLDFDEMPKPKIKRKRQSIPKLNLNDLFRMRLYHNPLTANIDTREGKTFVKDLGYLTFW